MTKRFSLSLMFIIVALTAVLFVSCQGTPNGKEQGGSSESEDTVYTGDKEIDREIAEIFKNAPEVKDERADKSKGRYPEGFDFGENADTMTEEEKEKKFYTNLVTVISANNDLIKYNGEKIAVGVMGGATIYGYAKCNRSDDKKILLSFQTEFRVMLNAELVVNVRANAGIEEDRKMHIYINGEEKNWLYN